MHLIHSYEVRADCLVLTFSVSPKEIQHLSERFSEEASHYDPVTNFDAMYLLCCDLEWQLHGQQNLPREHGYRHPLKTRFRLDKKQRLQTSCYCPSCKSFSACGLLTQWALMGVLWRCSIYSIRPAASDVLVICPLQL